MSINTILAYIFGGVLLYIVIYATYPIWRLFKRFFMRSAVGLCIISTLKYIGIGSLGANVITGSFCGILGIPGLILMEVIAKMM